MMNSMTGFGQGAAENDVCRLVVTLRGVNHRYLDLALRLPEELADCSSSLQRMVGEAVARGRLEVGVEVVPLAEPVLEVRVDTAAAQVLADAARDLEKVGATSAGLSVSDLLRIPEVVRTNAVPIEGSSSAGDLLLEAARIALDQLLAARRAEGERLEAVVLEKVDGLEGLVGRLVELRPTVQKELERSLGERLTQSLGETEIDPGRLAQEAALLADRSNVSEELERLSVHLEHMREVISGPGAKGKRLDFLVQEVFRELNTLSAKCRSSEMTRLCVDAKVLCEETREQLRNVE